jgi:hypothetical protein
MVSNDSMARRRLQAIYERVFFDRVLFVGIIFLALSYILRGSWGGAFAESATLVIGVVWSYRAATTGSSRVFRLLATLILVLIGSLLAIYLGRVQGLV